jgi:hypothetical protein
MSVVSADACKQVISLFANACGGIACRSAAVNECMYRSYGGWTVILKVLSHLVVETLR